MIDYENLGKVLEYCFKSDFKGTIEEFEVTNDYKKSFKNLTEYYTERKIDEV